jgi:hypothetical protein
MEKAGSGNLCDVGLHVEATIQYDAQISHSVHRLNVHSIDQHNEIFFSA